MNIQATVIENCIETPEESFHRWPVFNSIWAVCTRGAVLCLQITRIFHTCGGRKNELSISYRSKTWHLTWQKRVFSDVIKNVEKGDYSGFIQWAQSNHMAL